MKCFKFELYVPKTHASQLREAIGNAGAGRLGNYDHCVWETAGTGHFRPLSGSRPTLGSEGEIADVPEVKLEAICPESCLDAVIAAVRAEHPYETPAFQYWPVETAAER